MNLEHYKAIIETASFGYVCLEIFKKSNDLSDYKFIEANSSFFDLFNTGFDEIIGKKIKDLDENNICRISLLKILGDHLKKGDENESGTNGEIEYFFEEIKKWVRVKARCIDDNKLVLLFTDITDEKNKIFELDNFFLINLDLLCIADTEGHFLRVNKEWERLLGYKTDELENRKFIDFVHPDDIDATLEQLSQLGKESIVNNFINRYRCKDGAYKYIEWRSRPYGKLIYAAARDFTEHKEYEKTIIENQKAIERLAEHSRTIMWEIDADGLYTDVSPVVEKVLGYKPEELVNKKHFYDIVKKEEREVFKEEAFKIIHLHEPFNNLFNTLEDKNGNLLHFTTNGIPIFNEKGEFNGYRGTDMDITELKKVEDRLIAERDLFSDGPVFTIVWNPASTWPIEYVSKNVAGILGFTPDEMYDENFKYIEHIHPDDIERISDEVGYNMKNNINFYEQSYRLRLKSGEYRWFYDFTMLKRNTKNEIESIHGYLFDQTHLKSIEQNLKDEKRRLNDIIEGTNVGTWEWNIKTNKTVFNDRWANIIGYDKDELGDTTIETWMNFAHPDDLENSKILLNKHFNKETDYYECESRMRHKNGTWVWVLDRGKVSEWDENGKPVLMYGTHQDITEKKRSHEELKAIFDTTMDGFFMADINGIILTVNNSFCEMLGYSKEELLKMSISDIEGKMDDEEIARHIKIIETEANARFETIHKRKDGSLVSVEISGTTIDIDKKKIVIFVRDITSQKESERKIMEQERLYRGLIESQNDLIVRVDSEGRFTFVNERYCNMFGKTQNELIGKSFAPLVHEDDIENTMKAMKDLEKPPYRAYIEQRAQTRDGWRWISWEDNAVLDEEDNIVEIQGVGRDITNLKDAQRRAEEASKAKSEFLANMSHEIRTPLNSVIGFTDLLKSTPLNEVQKQYLDNANHSAHSLLNIISDILDFSKIEAGKLELEVVKTDLISLIEESIDIIKYKSASKNLELLINIPVDMPRYAIVDPIRLKQILINLLSNALKFTENGEIEIKVLFNPLDKKKGEFYFEVRDTGIGISEEQLSRLFKAFSQADNSTTRKYGGTGLGLIISNFIAEKMGGNIEVRSELEKGSSFYFTIIADYEYGDMDKKRTIDGVKKLLVIDDNENNRIILEHTVEKWGISYTGVDNGLSALKIIEESGNFDVIIVDYNMPYMDGLDTIKMIKEKFYSDNKKMPVILLHSSDDNVTIRESCKELGVRFRLIKPVKSGELFQYLKNINSDASEKIIDKTMQDNTEWYKKELLLANINPVIMVAEDVALNMMLIKELLVSLIPRVTIIEAINGRDAVDKLITNKVDIVFMDVQMPEMDGISATKEIRDIKNGKDVPIVALTAGAIKGERERCLQAGMDDFLTKPIDVVMLQQTLKKYLINTGLEKVQTYDEIHFDKDKLLKKINSNMDLYKRLITEVNKSIPQNVEQLKIALVDKDYEKVKYNAHTIKGLALNMCFERLAVIAKDFEKSDGERASALTDEIEKEWNEIKSVLN